MNDFGRQWADTGPAVLQAVARTGESGWYILGREVEAFEKELAAIWPSRFAVGVASGLDAIEISLRVLGCRAGDRVLVPPISAFATVLAVLKLQAVPVFVDADPSGLVSLERVRDLLRTRPGIRFFVPVHLYGHALNAAALESLRDEFGLKIVEDCAQSILTTSNGVPAGTVGQIAATSFYPTKNLGALGDGGAILTDDAELAALARELRDYGQSAKYLHTSIGYNSRLDELQAAILRTAFLPRLAAFTATRRRVAALYRAGIRSPHVTIPPQPAGSDSCCHLFPVLVDPASKAAFLAHLKGNGIGSGEHYPVALPDQPALTGVAHEVAGDCEAARLFCRSEVSLPIHPYLSDDEIAQVIAVCNDWMP